MRYLSPSKLLYRRGLTLADTLLSVAVLSVLAALAIAVFPGVRQISESTRLEKDTRTLNLAVAAYLNSGGRIPADATADAVLAKLKSCPPSAVMKTLPGLKGTMLDMRLAGKQAAPDSPGRRISWDYNKLAFRVAQSGDGWSEMTFDDSEVSMSRSADTRYAALPFASTEPWVWDYADTLSPLRGRTNIPVNNPAVTPPELPEGDFLLLPPEITPAPGEYSYLVFPLDVSIANPNEAGTSIVRYQINGGDWMTWTGGTQPLPRELTHNVQAFAESRDGETWQQSTTVEANYVSYFIRGQADVSFLNPVGESRLVQTVSADGNSFQWGKVESAGQAQSGLEFIPESTFEAGPGESFTIATLRYTNGLSRAGTNAVSVTATVTLPLTVPAQADLTVDMPLRMQNSIHYPWTPANEYQDYLWVPDTLPVVQPVVVLDRIYRLTLYTSAPGSARDGTDIKVPISEGQSVEVTVTARLDPL
jgi:type II secretory pathway pseudopilin PulG